jgi:hypothetical protein
MADGKNAGQNSSGPFQDAVLAFNAKDDKKT